MTAVGWPEGGTDAVDGHTFAGLGGLRVDAEQHAGIVVSEELLCVSDRGAEGDEDRGVGAAEVVEADPDEPGVSAGGHPHPGAEVTAAEGPAAGGPKDGPLRVGECSSLLLLLLCDRLVGLLLPLIAETLIEHQRQDVVLVILPCRLASQDVRGAPEVRFELLLAQPHRRSPFESAMDGAADVGYSHEPHDPFAWPEWAQPGRAIVRVVAPTQRM